MKRVATIAPHSEKAAVLRLPRVLGSPCARARRPLRAGGVAGGDGAQWGGALPGAWARLAPRAATRQRQQRSTCTGAAEHATRE